MEKNIFATVVESHSASAESKTVLVLQLLICVVPALDMDFGNKGLNS
ncbi:hypothetical protein ACQQ91_08860 [Selenomonas bovis]